MRPFLFMLLLALCRIATASSIALTTEDYPPFNMIDRSTGKISGIASDRGVYPDAKGRAAIYGQCLPLEPRLPNGAAFAQYLRLFHHPHARARTDV